MILLGAQIFLGLLSIANKLLLFLGRKSGWLAGMAIGLLSGFYFWAVGLKILAIAELGFFAVMFYGYILRVNPSKQKIFHINIVMSGLTILLCFFLFTGYLTIIQAISSLSFIWGGYLLSTTHKASGWLIFVVAHVTLFTASFHEQQYVFAGLQVISGLICVYALLVLPGRKMSARSG